MVQWLYKDSHLAWIHSTDGAVIPVSQVCDAIRELMNEGVEQWDPLLDCTRGKNMLKFSSL